LQRFLIFPAALIDAKGAFESWMAAQKEWGREYPKPASTFKASGKFVQRLPKSLHAKLVRRAKQEGVSLNTLVLSFIAEGIGERKGRPVNSGKEKGRS
jgi:antitoxin HicB